MNHITNIKPPFDEERGRRRSFRGNKDAYERSLRQLASSLWATRDQVHVGAKTPTEVVCWYVNNMRPHNWDNYDSWLLQRFIEEEEEEGNV